MRHICKVRIFLRVISFALKNIRSNHRTWMARASREHGKARGCEELRPQTRGAAMPAEPCWEHHEHTRRGEGDES